MSFFSGLSTLTHRITIPKEFAEYKIKFDGWVERENEKLRSIGITPPRIVSDLSYSTKIWENPRKKFEDETIIKVNSPRFEYPPHHVFAMKERGTAFTVFKDIEAAKSAYWWWGLGAAAKPEYGGIWTSRDPYLFYRQLEFDCDEMWYKESGDFTKKTESKETYAFQFLSHFRTNKLIPLEKITPQLSASEVSDVHSRAVLYSAVAPSSYRSVCGTSNLFPADKIPDEILFKLPVAPTWTMPEYACLKILPSGETKPSQMVEFLNNFRGSINNFISFELVRDGETVFYRLYYPAECKNLILSKLNLYYPEFECLDANFERKMPASGYHCSWLRKDTAYKSIFRLRDFQIDPYAHLASFFEKAGTGDLLTFQIMFAPITNEAAMTVKWHIEEEQRNYDNNLNNFVGKLPVWLVSVNVGSTNEQLSVEMTEDISRRFGGQNQSFFEPCTNHYTDTPFPNLFPAFLGVYDTDELASLAHFPITPLPIERLEKTSMKSVKPPESYSGDAGAVRVGETRTRGQIFPVTIPETVRDRHVYIVGKSGTGKSTIMETIARRDIEAGRGLAVIDPHGDLVHHLLEIIPEERVADCILFSPKHFPVSLEILSAENDHEIDLLSDDLITTFRRTSESWGDKMQAILQMAFQTLLRVPGSSFTDITRLLTDENFRNNLLAKINHPQLESFWTQRYEMRQAEPILIRMDRLTTSGTLRAVLTQNKNSLNFYDVITESKIFLADLSKGFLGESTSHLLGSIIVSQIQLAAMRQAHFPAEQRIPFSLFVDEVQNFTTSAFSTILSEARKQKLRLTIAHQFVSQLPQDLQKAVFGNVGTLFFFALSPDDLGAARHELGTFEPPDVANLPKYHALCRPATAARDTFSFATDPPPPVPAKNYAREIIEQTRREYSSNYEAQPETTDEPQVQTPRATAIGFIQPKKAEAPPPIQLRPADAVPPVFTTNTEKILHYLRQADYLTQPQIIALTELLPPNASTALKKLCETAQIKSLDDRRPKIYFIGRTCNATTHNILVRDLFVKICASRFATRSIKFNENLADLNPDLSVEFVPRQDQTLTPLPAYFELDRGTEGVQELVKKADRYARLTNNPRVGFIFERESDLHLARKTIEYHFIYYALLNDFTSLRDEAFYAGSSASLAADSKLPFFDG